MTKMKVTTDDMTVQDFLHKVPNPQVFTGLELNAIKKDNQDKKLLDVCIVFPDKYEIGMSHYGHKLLYHMLNRRPDVRAERCFLPDKAAIATFKEYNFPLFSLENKIPLKDFDILGFSLLSEMTFTNVLQVLDLAGIPLRAKDRDATYPLVIAGGISAVNPEPLREFMDCFAFGDGEVLFPDIIQVLEGEPQSRTPGKERDKKQLLQQLDKVQGIYVPGLYPVQKMGRFYGPGLDIGAIKKRITRDIDDSFPDEEMVVPLTNAVFDRLTIEIARGCPHACRFCQARSYYAPYRSKSLEKIFDFLKGSLAATGFEAFSLTSLSSGDYPHLQELLELIPTVIQPGISFSISSLRPSTISSFLLSTISLFRRTGITIVPEAGSERLRRVINKNVTDEEIFKAVELALKYDWQKIKLYFMIGLPTETMDDMEAIVKLIDEIVQRVRVAKKKIKIHVSFSPFVPKAHTPLQWSKRENQDEFHKKIKYIKENLKKYRKMDLDFHDPKNSMVETIIARGDYRVGELLLYAMQHGEIFSAWDGDFHFSNWKEIMKDGDYDTFLDEIPQDERLPWDFLQVNFHPAHLVEEYKKALGESPTPACTAQRCKECGGCMHGYMGEAGGSPDSGIQEPGTKTNRSDEVIEKKKPVIETPQYNKIRVFYEKSGDFIFFSQITMLKYLDRIIRRSGIDFKCSGGFHPRMKIAALPPLPVYATGLDEVVELFVDPFLSEEELLAALRKAGGALPFKKVLICNTAPNLTRDIVEIEFEILLENPHEIEKVISPFLVETDRVTYLEDRIIFYFDYTQQGQERFPRIYKAIDPEKKNTVGLTRKKVSFFH